MRQWQEVQELLWQKPRLRKLSLGAFVRLTHLSFPVEVVLNIVFARKSDINVTFFAKTAFFVTIGKSVQAAVLSIMIDKLL